MGDKSFDIISKVDKQSVKNAVNQAVKEISQRYDFKGSKSEIRYDNDSILVVSDDSYKLSAVIDVLKNKLVRAGVSLKTLDIGSESNALGGLVKQNIKIEEGISQENAKKITKDIKALKLKVQAQIQKDQLRVSGKKIDDLQEVMNILKGKDYDFNLEFSNFR